MDKWRGKTGLVTGASEGIGFAILEALARHGVNVIGCARNVEKILELKGRLTNGPSVGNIEAIKCDLCEEAEILEMFRQVERQNRFISVLVNNAAMATTDDLLTGDTKNWRYMIELNVLGLSICTRETLKLLAKNGVDDAHIININSITGHEILEITGVHFYGATKHMLTALTKMLKKELVQKKSNIRVTSLSPGAVKTDFARKWVGENYADLLKSCPIFKLLEPSDIADAVIYVLSAPSHVNVSELTIVPTSQPSL